MNIHDPKFAAWWPTASHQREAYIYNKAWEIFLETKPGIPSVKLFGRAISQAFGLTVNY